MTLMRPSSLHDRGDPTTMDQQRERGPPTMSLARAPTFSISLDGFGTGDGQSQDAPFGHAGERLHQWMFTTRFWHKMTGRPGGTAGLDDAFARQFEPGIGAEIMGSGKFGPPGWHEVEGWKGRGGPHPPFPTPALGPTGAPRRAEPKLHGARPPPPLARGGSGVPAEGGG